MNNASFYTDYQLIISILLIVMGIAIGSFLNSKDICPFLNRCIIKSKEKNICLLDRKCTRRFNNCYMFKYLKILEQFGLEENKINEMINDIIKKNIGEIN